MLAAVKIKEEPLDELDNLQEVFRQQETLMKQQFLMDKIKDEFDADTSLPPNNFHIVDEQDSIITVSAGDMKSAAELQFIETLNNTQEDLSKFKGVCTKCLKMFTNRALFLKHTKRLHCITKQKCPVCPVTFVGAPSLLKHLKLHQDNYFFCSRYCGANFKTLALLEEHELKEHKVHNPPKIRYNNVCSFCRDDFKTELQLHVHWLQKNHGCGKLMQDVAMHFIHIANTEQQCGENKSNKKNINNSMEQKSNNPTPVTTFPITKLRLKSSVEPILPASKRVYEQMNNEEDTDIKRMKMLNQIKSNTETLHLPLHLPLHFEEQVQIKEEPLDEEYNNINSNFIPEVIIKTEEDKPEDKPEEIPKTDNKPEMKSLFINNMLNPEFNGKIIPLSVHSAVPNKMPLLRMFNTNTASNVYNNNNINNNNIYNNNNINNNNFYINNNIPSNNINDNNNIHINNNINNNNVPSNNINNNIVSNNNNNIPINNNINNNNMSSNNINNNNISSNNINNNNNIYSNNISSNNNIHINNNIPTNNININNTINIIKNNNNNSLPFKNLPNASNLKLIKLTPASIASSNYQFSKMSNGGNQAKLIPLKFASPIQNNNGNLKPLPKTGLQILKFLPKTQILSFKPMNQNGTTTNMIDKKSLVIKLESSPLQHVLKPVNPTNPPPLIATTTPTANTSITPTLSTSNPLNNSLVSLKLNSIDHNTTTDCEDLKKLQFEALIKADENRKNFVISRNRLKVIENLPEKKQIIDSIKQQIAQTEINTEQLQQGNGGTIKGFTPTVINKSSADNFVLNDKNIPPSLYLPILSTMDVELIQARYQNPEFIYRYLCPYCSKCYDLKKSLQTHLVKAHHLVFRDMEKINVQAKAFKNEELEIEINQQIKQEIIQQDYNDSQYLNSETNVMPEDSTTNNPKPIKMSVFKPRKPRFVCNQCGRKCSSKTMLNDHIQARCSREPIYSCKLCPKKFYSHGTLQCHMSIHTGELPHKCNYCDKRFRTRGQVTVHHRTHTGERPFICQVCAQRFTHRETLIAHLSRHIGMKRYKCYGCDKNFSCISALKTHREIREDSCGKVKFNPRAVGPRVRVIRGTVVFEAQPEINPYLKSEDPKGVLTELQNQQPEMAN